MTRRSNNAADTAKLKAMGVKFHNGLPIFPFVPDSIKESRFVVIEAGTLAADEDVPDLIQQMWLEPEVDFYYFYGHTGGPTTDTTLLGARNRGDILMDVLERRYYKDPIGGPNYVKITPQGDEYERDWQKEVVEKGPEFWRVTLRLSQRKRDEMDAWRKVQLEEHFRQEARRAHYAYDVFLSFSKSDTAEAEGLYKEITEAGHKVFMAPKAMKPGDDFAEEIRLSLHGSKELWLLVSPSSSKSEWVITEWGAAWALGKRIVPILYRCPPDLLPARLGKLQCVDLHRSAELIRLLGASRKKTSEPR